MPLLAQDLSQIGRSKTPFKLTGTLSANQVYYDAFGIPNRRPPYNYFLSGSVNIGIYGWNVPLSYTYSNQQSQFQQPFNQFGATPYYKWIKFYAGYNNMIFSSYSLNGHVFLGGGVELKPGIFRFSAMYGRLNRAIQEDTNNVNIVPYYERMGMGMKIGVGKDRNFLDFIFFRGEDNPNSIRPPMMQTIQPGENAIASFVASKSVTKWVTLSGEYATSAYTNDVRSPVATESSVKVLGANLPGFTNRTTSSTSNAYNAKATYSKDGLTLGVGYERIDPEYRTMGSYFFNNDFENYTANAGKKFLEGRLNVAGSVGIQRSNLKGDKISGMNRNIYSANVSFSPTPKLSFSSSYSNFQSVTRVRNQFERLTAATPQDTLQLNSLDFVQLTQNANTIINYIVGDPASRYSKNIASLNVTYQNVGNTGAANQRVAPGANFYNAVASFNRTINPANVSYTLAMNTNINESIGLRVYLVGPTATFSKSFFNKKLKGNTSVSWINSYLNRFKINDILNVRLNITYTIKKQHQFNLSNTGTYRANYLLPEAANKQPDFFEITMNMGYAFSF